MAFDLNARLAGMSGLLNPSFGPNIRLETDFSSALWPVIADPNQLEVAILNLAVNARDAMPPEGGAFTLQTRNVTLAATPERRAGDYVRLAVSDTGSGMTPGVLAHVFEPFFTTKAQGKGTGLGLAQVYGFARQSGGDVAIKSAPGQGTTISFYLPRPTDTALAEAARNQDEDGTAVLPPQQPDGRTVLVVEDNPDLASFTVSILEGYGYSTRYAANAADAIVIIEAGETVDAVFSDIVMPGPMNGLQLASLLRVQYPHLPVVLASGYSQPLVEWDGPTVAEVLNKPYRLIDLTSALGRAFAAARIPVPHDQNEKPGHL
jgi:CheY-like chemotaxis protein